MAPGRAGAPAPRTARRHPPPELLAPGRLAPERLLPLRRDLAGLFPGGGLVRGATLVVAAPAAPGATSLLCSLLAGASAAGHWCAVAGLPELGLLAASEAGADLARLVLVPHPGPDRRWQGVVATLLETVDLVCVAPTAPVRPGDARRLAARARERGASLVVFDPARRPGVPGAPPRPCWPGPADLRCTVASSDWEGLEAGHGRLRARRLEVEVSGRGVAHRVQRGDLAERAPA